MNNEIFNNWIPEVYRISKKNYDKLIKDIILTHKEGIYIAEVAKDYNYLETSLIGEKIQKRIKQKISKIDLETDWLITITYPRLLNIENEKIFNDKLFEIISKYIPETFSLNYENSKIFVNNNEIGKVDFQNNLIKTSYYQLQMNFSFLTDPENEVLLKNKIEEDFLSWLLKIDGTIENPIIAQSNMIYYTDKYYLDPEDENIYQCIKDDNDGNGTSLYYMPHDLVGAYFELIQNNEEE